MSTEIQVTSILFDMNGYELDRETNKIKVDGKSHFGVIPIIETESNKWDLSQIENNSLAKTYEGSQLGVKRFVSSHFVQHRNGRGFFLTTLEQENQYREKKLLKITEEMLRS